MDSGEHFVAQITLADGDDEELLVSPVGPNLYRLEESSVLGDLKFHDIIEAEGREDGGLRFLRVVTPSALKVVTWVGQQERFESPSVLALLGRVVALGGNWERTFGGVLMLHLPPHEESSIVSELNSLLGVSPSNPS